MAGGQNDGKRRMDCPDFAGQRLPATKMGDAREDASRRLLLEVDGTTTSLARIFRGMSGRWPSNHMDAPPSASLSNAYLLLTRSSVVREPASAPRHAADSAPVRIASPHGDAQSNYRWNESQNCRPIQRSDLTKTLRPSGAPGPNLSKYFSIPTWISPHRA